MLYINEDDENKKIAIICSHPLGGAGTAAWRLSKSIGGDLISCTQTYNTELEDSHIKYTSNHKYTNTYFTIYTEDLPKQSPDNLIDTLSQYEYINIHWISGFISLNLLNLITNLDKKIFITCHDYWHFTGGCHYPAGCDKFSDQYGCYRCPQINDDIQELNIKVYQTHLNKLKILQKPNVYLTAPSNFILTELAKALRISPNDSKLHLLRNPFEPSSGWLNCDKHDKLYNYVICAGSIKEKRKGYDLLFKSFAEIIKKHKNVRLHIISKEIDYDVLKPNLHDYIELHHCSNYEQIENVYKKCDFVINSSFEENWSNVLVESGCYGCIPIVASNHGSAEYVRRYSQYNLIYDQNDKSIYNILKRSLNIPKNDMIREQEKMSKIVKKEHSNSKIKSEFYNIIKNTDKPAININTDRKEFVSYKPFYVPKLTDSNYEWLKQQSYTQQIISSTIINITQLDLHIISRAITEALKDHSLLLKVKPLIKPGVEMNNKLIKLSIITDDNTRSYYDDEFDIKINKNSSILLEANNEGYYGIRSFSVCVYVEPSL